MTGGQIIVLGGLVGRLPGAGAGPQAVGGAGNDVYVFNRDGIDYIQVNDANGTVRAAYATASDAVRAIWAARSTARSDESEPSVPTTTV